MRALVIAGAAFLASTPLAGSVPQAPLHPYTIAWGHGSLIAVGGKRGSVGGLFTVDPSSRQIRLLTTKVDPTLVTGDWTPDGKTLVFEGRGKISAIRSDGSGLHVLASGYVPSLSPDARRIAFDGPGGLFVMNANGTGARRLVQDRYHEGGPAAWSPNGRKLAYIACSAAFLSQPCEHEYGFDVYTIGVDGKGKHRVTKHSGLPHCVAWSSAGKLAFTTQDAQLAIVQADGSLRTFKIVGCPVWAPGGHRLATGSGRFGPTLLNADGSGKKQLHVLKKPTFSTGAVAWSGDGRRLAYQTEAGGAKSRVFVVGADGSAPKQILPAG